MRTPQPFAIDMTSKLFFNMKDLFEHNPEFFYGCTVKKRLITKKKNIPESEYVYANFFVKTKEWNLSDESCKKAQLLITKAWVDKYYFRNDDAVVASVPVASPVIIAPIPSPIIVPLVQEEQKEDIKQEDSERKEDKEVIKNAPPILELSDEEKFHDVDGNIIEIETRGERHEDKIYFKCKHISVGFRMEHLSKNITDKTKGYNRGSDYTFFIRNNSSPNGGANKKTLYLTYEGLLRVLFVSRNKNATIFRKWATMKLFTIQMGTKEAKEILGADILNIKIKDLRAVFNKHSSDFPCVYLLSLGKVSDLRETLGISPKIEDDIIVYKYGFTKDFKQRISQHQSTYGKMKNVDLDVELFNIVDAQYTTAAEHDIRYFFKAFGKPLVIEGHNELVGLNKMELVETKNKYVSTGEKYAGSTKGYETRTKELQEEIATLKQEIQHIKNEMKMKELEHKFALQEEQMRTMEERKEKERFQTLVETNDRIHTLEKNNYELRLLNKN